MIQYKKYRKQIISIKRFFKKNGLVIIIAITIKKYSKKPSKSNC